MKLLKSLFFGLAVLTLSACATTNEESPFNSFGQKASDAVVDVSDVNRDLRICWMTAGAIEVMTDLAQRGGDVPTALSTLTLMQGAIDKARNFDALWAETDAADVSFLFARVLKDMGRSRLSQMLLDGPTIGNFLNVAKRTIVLTVKGYAVLRDINRVLTGVETGIIDKVKAWKACEDRTAMNRNSLRMMLGLTVSYTGEFVGPQIVGWGHGWIGGDRGGGGHPIV